MRFREALPLLPSVALLILVGAYLWVDRGIDGAAEQNYSRPAASTQSDTWSSSARPDVELAALQPPAPTTTEGSAALAELQQTVQALQLSNKTLSDQIGALTDRLDNLEKARAEMRESPRGRTRRR